MKDTNSPIISNYGEVNLVSISIEYKLDYECIIRIK